MMAMSPEHRRAAPSMRFQISSIEYNTLKNTVDAFWGCMYVMSTNIPL